MNRQERRRWMRRHVASELAARHSRERREPADEPVPPGRDFVPEERPFVLAFELADDDTATPDGNGRVVQETNGSIEGTAPIPNVESATQLLDRAAEEASVAGDRTRAIGIFRELLAQDPDNLSARCRLAALLDACGETEAALDEIELCVAMAPGSDVLVTRASLLGRLRRFREAERDLRGVLRNEPANAEAHFRLGVVIAKKGLWRNAIPYLRRAIELDAARAAAHHCLGEALNHVDDLDGALQSFQRSNELRPNNADTLYGLGIVLDRLNRPDDAAQMYRRSRELAAR